MEWYRDVHGVVSLSGCEARKCWCLMLPSGVTLYTYVEEMPSTETTKFLMDAMEKVDVEGASDRAVLGRVYNDKP